jgi:hypothetical protein
VGQRPLLCPLHGARCDATPARTCITMSRYEAQYGTGGLIPASTLTLIIPESSSDLYEDLLSLPPSVPSGHTECGPSWLMVIRNASGQVERSCGGAKRFLRAMAALC